ncbi:MAG: signal recognition particle protein [Chloracidobacterium sp.]|uniref:Signal recognition particle protein n=1 Tax=Chloracidobacterium validum TaxID=2821543 RepID=A0ABX8B5Z9_9BACT|nr:signal recognition particle protein [Chloracidobacterium validum]QUW02392.1 signal recognition particle protein [Chloracidobacterium validum]
MFETLSEKLKKTLKTLRGESKLTEAHITAAMGDIRIALLEADVNYGVVKQFVERVKEKALGQEVWQSLSPAQQVVKIVFDEMVELLGGDASEVTFTAHNPNVILMVGLQGSGKTTSTGKIARFLAQQRKRHPLLVSVDVYRPAARDQLSVIGKAIGVPVYEDATTNDPLALARAAYRDAQLRGFDTLLVDTAGRLHIDDELMTELAQLKSELNPIETLFVADAMIGQDAVRSATEFHERIGLTGVVLSKMDGDARGGAALSIRSMIGQPIKFVGVGEKYDALESFYPDRIAQRILGMGDVLSLIEKVQQEVDEAEAVRLQQRMLENRFTLEDYRAQLRQVGKLGSLDKLLGMLPDGLLPGLNLRMTPQQTQMMQRKLKETEAIINSMTKQEREDHTLLAKTLSRRKRVARGSGMPVRKVEELLNEFSMMRRMMQQMTRGGLFGGLGGLFGGGMGGGLGGLLPTGPRGGGGGGMRFGGGMGGGKRSKQHTPSKKKKRK